MSNSTSQLGFSRVWFLPHVSHFISFTPFQFEYGINRVESAYT